MIGTTPTDVEGGFTHDGAALDIRRLSKTFAGAAALRDVGLNVLPGEIHALVGENGSGKSTLIKVLSGYHVPDPGADIHVGGVLLPEGNPTASHRLGCRFVHQDLGLVDTLSVADNLTVGIGYPTRLGTIRSKDWYREVRAALELVGLDVDPDLPVAQLAPAARTGVALARAIRADAHSEAVVLVLDEPTASLPSPQVIELHQMIRTVVATGVGVVYVSHHLQEVFDLADRVTVLRDGATVATRRPADLDHRALVELIVGGTEPSDIPPVAVAGESRAILTVRGLRRGPLRGLDLDARSGQILGIAGLTGSGRDVVLPTVFGALPRDGGTIAVDGTELVGADPRQAMRLGVAYLPPDRKTLGGVMGHTARENFAVTDLREFWRFPFLRRRRERTAAEQWFTRLDVRPADAVDRNLETLSGGNQQKVLLAKWLRRSPALLLLEEPTQGVDIAAKALLHGHIVSAARDGACVLVSSADNEELAGLCDAVVVLRRGVLRAWLVGADLTPAAITHASLGEAEEQAAS